MSVSLTKSSARWRWFFYAAAAFNFLIGVPGMIAAGDSNQRIVGLLVACFGIVYALVARDPARFGPSLWAGVVGKVGVVAILAPSVIAGSAPPGLGLILAGDALFTLGFLVYLLKPR
jgi:hypothetical protein